MLPLPPEAGSAAVPETTIAQRANWSLRRGPIVQHAFPRAEPATLPGRASLILPTSGEPLPTSGEPSRAGASGALAEHARLLARLPSMAELALALLRAAPLPFAGDDGRHLDTDAAYLGADDMAWIDGLRDRSAADGVLYGTRSWPVGEGLFGEALWLTDALHSLAVYTAQRNPGLFSAEPDDRDFAFAWMLKGGVQLTRRYFSGP